MLQWICKVMWKLPREVLERDCFHLRQMLNNPSQFPSYSSKNTVYWSELDMYVHTDRCTSVIIAALSQGSNKRRHQGDPQQVHGVRNSGCAHSGTSFSAEEQRAIKPGKHMEEPQHAYSQMKEGNLKGCTLQSSYLWAVIDRPWQGQWV